MTRLSFVAFCLLAACSHKDSPHADKAATAPPPTGSAAAPAGDTAAQVITPPGSQDLAPLAQLPNALAAEVKSRPQTKVPVEKVFSALDAKGIKIVRQEQVLAVTAAASYCALGVTADTVSVAVCEYPTHEAAVAGGRMMDVKYKKLAPDAVREINGNTLVTIVNSTQHHDVRDQVIETFKAL